MQFNKCTHIPWEDQCELYKVTRMSTPKCAIVCNLINTHTYTHKSFFFLFHAVMFVRAFLAPRDSRFWFFYVFDIKGVWCAIPCCFQPSNQRSFVENGNKNSYKRGQRNPKKGHCDCCTALLLLPRALSLQNLVLGWECGKAFPAGVGSRTHPQEMQPTGYLCDSAGRLRRSGGSVG